MKKALPSCFSSNFHEGLGNNLYFWALRDVRMNPLVSEKFPFFPLFLVPTTPYVKGLFVPDPKNRRVYHSVQVFLYGMLAGAMLITKEDTISIDIQYVYKLYVHS